MRSTTLILSSFLLSLLLFTSSCTNYISCGGDKEAFVDNFYNFIEELTNEQKQGTISDSQWESYDAKFKKLTEECFPQFEKELTTTDQLGVAASVATYYYAKHGMGAMIKLAQAELAIQKVLLEIDYTVLFNAATEILNNPDEIHQIMDDLEKRYGK
ncbi:DUF6565 domain-containing protein [Aureispira sp. CCB-QB1]|uniref:DUF6565 domain-containing protein n=1 Tax=Aureispira sp. CCB-QB1 TaxID=1313421 RepID=UPI000698D090|nr:DUF6565 domain-containing protein [Aureispira sp. CCB-QB1]